MEAKDKKVVDSQTLNDEIINFISDSPTPYHAVFHMEKILKASGFKKLEEGEAWQINSGEKYYLIRNGSSLVALNIGDKAKLGKNGFRMIGAHTDSPCLKVKPNPELETKNYLQLGVEIYGGVLLSTWFDRDLSLAGRVTYLSKDQKVKSVLIDFKKAIAYLPNLAIHLDRTANENRNINKQKEMPPLILQLQEHESFDFKNILLDQVHKQGGADAREILSYDLCFYDTQRPAIVGLRGDFLSGARLDNLLSCYVGLRSFLEASSQISSVLVCNDHEEVGSASFIGASGPFLKSILERLSGNLESYHQAISNSLFISCDNAHGIHPNYPEKHDHNHGPLLNAGPVIKMNANQRYASMGDTSGIFQYLCKKADIPFQHFVARSDMGCGSTIGPLTSTVLGIRAIDVGLPTFGMHSTREMSGTKDCIYLYKALKEFFKTLELF